jgi:superfamily II DNA/RNA helicase
MKIQEIINKLGITPNAMQEESIDAVLHHRDNITILSPTGSGKTLAYLLPLTQLVSEDCNEVQAVIIVPGRELALQSSTVLNNMKCGLRSMAVYGGRPTMDEHRMMRKVQPQILFGTPGRLNDHLDKGNFLSDTVKFIIIDEFDKCLEMGFHEEMQNLISKLPEKARQILLSATPAEEMREQHIINTRFKTLNYLQDEEQVPARVRIYKVDSPEKDKLQTLAYLLSSFKGKSTIVFLNYRDSVERTVKYLHEQGFSTSFFHGGLEQKQREAALYKFSNGSVNILVATDLASRGLDIPNIDNIVHYHIPESEDGYIHRVGRTARWEAKGKAFFLLGPGEVVPDYVDEEVEEYEIPEETVAFRKEHDKFEVFPALMATIYIGKGKKDKISKGDILGFLCKKAGLKGNEIGRIDIEDRFCYAAVLRSKVNIVINQTKGEKIKGIRTVVEKVK